MTWRRSSERWSALLALTKDVVLRWRKHGSEKDEGDDQAEDFHAVRLVGQASSSRPTMTADAQDGPSLPRRPVVLPLEPHERLGCDHETRWPRTTLDRVTPGCRAPREHVLMPLHGRGIRPA